MLEYYFEKLKKRKESQADPAAATYMLSESEEAFPEGLGTMDFRKTKTNDAAEERALALLWKDSRNLHVCAVMEDSDVFNVAVKKNEHTWATGDVMEFFIQPPNAENYYELHITPELVTLELSLPGEQKRREVEFSDMFYDSGFSYDAGQFSIESGLSGWWGHMIIPFTGVGLSADTLKGAAFSVCRYNYSRDRELPEMSSTSFYPNGQFHTPSSWHKII